MQESQTATAYIALLARDLWKAIGQGDESAQERVWRVGRDLIPIAHKHGMSAQAIAETMKVDEQVIEEIMKEAA